MSEFKVGDRVVRTNMDLTHVAPDVAKRFMSGEVFTVVDVVGTKGDIKLAGLRHNWSQNRFSLVSEDTSNYYKNYDIVIAWMQGKTIQLLDSGGVWRDRADASVASRLPAFNKGVEYRIKPEPCPKEDKLECLVNKLEEQLKEAQGQLKELRNE